MPVLFCPRCHRSNPDSAAFCYFDGAELRSRQDGSYHRLAREFVFPSGRRCRTFDDFAQGCRDEWPAARDLLRQGLFTRYFGGAGRTDLAKAANEALAQADADIALTVFLDALPVTQTQAPKIDINPRRLLLGSLLAGEQRQLQLTVTNCGHGTLQGTLTITEGANWIKLDGAKTDQCVIATPREQVINLRVDTRGLPAGGTFGAKIRVITNGGAVEVMARMDLMAQPFGKAPFQGARTPREMAELMRKQPKAAVPMLESGDVSRWFTANGWNFPVRGTQAKGVAGVQQFFETMGLSKPPIVQLEPAEIRVTCTYPEIARPQLTLKTAAKKWVYASVTSDSAWLRLLTPQVGGPQQATIAVEIDSQLGMEPHLEGKLWVTANGGKVIIVPVSADVRGVPRKRRAVGVAAAPGESAIIVGVPIGSRSSGLANAALAMACAFFLVRLVLVPFVDFGAQAHAMADAATQLGVKPGEDSPLSTTAGRLQLPWNRILMGQEATLPAKIINPAQSGELSVPELRHYFTAYFLRRLALWTWWLGAVVGGLLMLRNGGGPAQLPWGIVAGAAAGFFGSITLGALFLVIECVPHFLWSLAPMGSLGAAGLVLWIVLALLCWAACGALLGAVLGLLAPCKRMIVTPVQRTLARLCRLCGLRALGRACGA
jgi:hypothetical protein